MKQETPVIAIPSHKRADSLHQKTISTAIRCGFKSSQIHVFISPDDDEQLYRDSLFKDISIIKTDATNAVEKFNYIHRYYSGGQNVIVMEDDLDDILVLDDAGKLHSCLNLDEMMFRAFAGASMVGARLIGISPTANPFYMAQTVKTGLYFAVANMYAFIASGEPVQCTQICKSDYERTILYFLQDKRVVRINMLCAKTKNYTNKGGQQALDNRKELEQSAVNYLVNKYPRICKQNTKTKSIYPELSLKKA